MARRRSWRPGPAGTMAVILRVRGPLTDGVQAMLKGVPGVKRAEVIDEGQAEQAYRILPKDGQPIISGGQPVRASAGLGRGRIVRGPGAPG